MTQIMTPLEMTEFQVNKAVGNYRAMLEKHAGNFQAEHVQAVLGDKNFASAQFDLFRQKVESRSKILVRDFNVDPELVGMKAIRATGRKFYGNEKVAEEMPQAKIPSGKIHFFQTERYTPVGELTGEAQNRGLELLDPHSLAAYNEANPEFADTHPNGTQWVDANGKVCYATFFGWNVERGVCVGQRDGDWDDGWWFAGVSK